MAVTRRDFLRFSAAGAIAVGGIPVWHSARAAEPGAPLLVVVFLRGGADGLSLVPPIGDPHYAKLRGPLAIENPLAEGLHLIHKKLFSLLSEEGVERLELEGEPFDPEVAEAITVVPVDDPDEHDRVARVVQAGYQLGGKTLRPARVQVGRLSS